MTPNEAKVLMWVDNASRGEEVMSDETMDYICGLVKESLKKQFGGNKRDSFRLRMSNVGRPNCVLWFDKNAPEKALPKPNTFLVRMSLGDYTEALLKGILKEAGVGFSDSENVELTLDDGTTIKGELDLCHDEDGGVSDIKSASNWSYVNKFDSFETLADGDAFGYVGQLAGYALAKDVKPSGWWVCNIQTGDIKFTEASGVDLTKEMQKIEDTNTYLNINEFVRCYEPVEETHYKKKTGNKILNTVCSMCDYKFACWGKALRVRPSIPSQGKNPRDRDYVYIEEEDKK